MVSSKPAMARSWTLYARLSHMSLLSQQRTNRLRKRAVETRKRGFVSLKFCESAKFINLQNKAHAGCRYGSGMGLFDLKISNHENLSHLIQNI